jgi:DNA polymerase/3'-5' exonuclease PolX
MYRLIKPNALFIFFFSIIKALMSANNKVIIAGLEKLRQRYDEEGDENRERAYQRAIDSINRYGGVITSGDHAKQLPGIGDGIAWRIDQMLGTTSSSSEDQPSGKSRNKPPKLKEPTRRKEKQTQSPDVSMQPQIQYKVKLLDQPSRPHVSSAAAVSLPKLPSQLQSFIPRIFDNIKALFGPDFHVVLAGDFRRCIPNPRHIIILVTEKTSPKTITKSEQATIKVFENLRRSGHLTSDNRDKQTGLVCYIVPVAAVSWPFALMKYTGPSDFWKQIQAHAQQRGYQLTESGLKCGGISENCKTEKDIFHLLGMQMIDPIKRY